MGDSPQPRGRYSTISWAILQISGAQREVYCNTTRLRYISPFVSSAISEYTPRGKCATSIELESEAAPYCSTTLPKPSYKVADWSASRPLSIQIEKTSRAGLGFSESSWKNERGVRLEETTMLCMKAMTQFQENATVRCYCLRV